MSSNNTKTAIGWQQSLLVATIALFVRIFFGYVYFGSYDVIALTNITIFATQHAAANIPVLNYFPLLIPYLWIAALTTVYTSLPIAFCFKLIPILFDAGIALLIMHILEARGSSKAFMGGLAYALCPVSILITCIHGQWESAFLFFILLAFYLREHFKPSLSLYALIGSLLAYALLIKTPTLLFLPWILKPLRGTRTVLGKWWNCWVTIAAGLGLSIVSAFAYIKYYETTAHTKLPIGRLLAQFQLPILLIGAIVFGLIATFLYTIYKHYTTDIRMYTTLHLSMIAGFCITIAISFLGFMLLGIDLLRVLDDILRYCNQGVQILGLPLGVSGLPPIIATILKNRVWLIGLMALISLGYYKERFDVWHASLFMVAGIIGFTGLGPQYLLWIIPFLLITNHYVWTAVYGFVATVCLTLFYACPGSNPVVPYQNALSFAPLSWSTLFSPPAWITGKNIYPIFYLVGNLLLPIISIILLVSIWRKTKMYTAHNSLPVSTNTIWLTFITSNVLLLLTMLATWSWLAMFELVAAQKTTAYETMPAADRLSALFTGMPYCNVVIFFLLAGAVWAWCIFRQTKTKGM